jgi:hypothetical protein
VHKIESQEPASLCQLLSKRQAWQNLASQKKKNHAIWFKYTVSWLPNIFLIKLLQISENMWWKGAMAMIFPVYPCCLRAWQTLWYSSSSSSRSVMSWTAGFFVPSCCCRFFSHAWVHLDGQAMCIVVDLMCFTSVLWTFLPLALSVIGHMIWLYKWQNLLLYFSTPFLLYFSMCFEVFWSFLVEIFWSWNFKMCTLFWANFSP